MNQASQSMARREVEAFIEDYGHKATGVILAEDTTFESLGMDEIDIMEMVMYLEDALDIIISDDDAEKWKKVGDAWAYLTERGF